MTLQYIIDNRGRKKGVFLSLHDWLNLKKELDLLHKKISSIEIRRKQIRRNFLKSRREKQNFSFDISDLKEMVK